MSDNSFSPLAQEIADELNETLREPITQIERALTYCGVETVQQLLEETRAVEAKGGQMVPDGSRRRTIGGVFFNLLREKVGRIMWGRIHIPSHLRHYTDPLKWEDRLDLFRAAMSHPGEATAARLLVFGRPTDVKQRDGFVIVTVYSGGEWPTLSRELPQLPDLPTTYKVCIVSRQWRKIAGLLRNPQDKLIAEGYAVPNPQQPVVVLFAIRATTHLQQKIVRTRQSLRGLA